MSRIALRSMRAHSLSASAELGTRPNNCACSCRPAATSRLVASLDHGRDLRDEFLAREAGRQRIEKFDHDRPGIAHEGAARPEQAGIERHRQTRSRRNRHRPGRRRSCSAAAHRPRCACLPGKMINWRPRRTSSPARRAISISDRPPAPRNNPDHVGLDQIPAEKRDPFQLALEDVKRLRKKLQQREGLPHRLVLRRDDQRSFRNFLDAAIFDPGVADHAHQPDAAARPALRERSPRPIAASAGSAGRRSPRTPAADRTAR